MAQLTKPLSNLQVQLLKVFSGEISETDLLEIKRMLVKYFAEKAIAGADQVWDKNEWTDEDVEQLLKRHQRTPYSR